MIQVFGLRGSIAGIEEIINRLQQISVHFNVCLQIVNAEKIYGSLHLISSAEHAVRSFIQNTNSTNSLAMEILLYTAGERQISHALEKMRIHTETKEIAVVLIQQIEEIVEAKGLIPEKDVLEFFDTYGFEIDITVLDGNINTLHEFGLSDEEIASVDETKYQDLILEKVARVDISK